jgi:hypothetical protein
LLISCQESLVLIKMIILLNLTVPIAWIATDSYRKKYIMNVTLTPIWYWNIR